MNELSGLVQDERLFITDISTCIPSCEKCIYDTTCLDAKMGDSWAYFNKKIINKVNNHVTKEKITMGRI
ncbi:MAG: hypothetical protein JSW60_06535 [Thermoplasmatales archaeon]|nr:MAG: hypothetical protein JSW60_06535 [Thermoplasmatales archaeon]